MTIAFRHLEKYFIFTYSTMATKTIRCPNCDVTIKIRGAKLRAKSSKRVARGKRLARELPRDEKGRFLPRGSENLFRGKTAKRKIVKAKRKGAPGRTIAREKGRFPPRFIFEA